MVAGFQKYAKRQHRRSARRDVYDVWYCFWWACGERPMPMPDYILDRRLERPRAHPRGACRFKPHRWRRMPHAWNTPRMSLLWCTRCWRRRVDVCGDA